MVASTYKGWGGAFNPLPPLKLHKQRKEILAKDKQNYHFFPHKPRNCECKPHQPLEVAEGLLHTMPNLSKENLPNPKEERACSRPFHLCLLACSIALVALLAKHLGTPQGKGTHPHTNPEGSWADTAEPMRGHK